MTFLRYIDGSPLLFTSISFWAFFAVLLAGYTLVHQHPRARSLYLLIFSLFFYYKSSGLFFILLIFSIVTSYIITKQIPQRRSQSAKRWLVGINVALSLSLLSYFKYSYLAVDVLNTLLGTDIQVVNHLAIWANLCGGHFDTSQILLPVGISFYLFQSISYTVDVYRQKLEPAQHLIDYALYVSFFPQLVAGPIVRAAEFMPQTHAPYRLNRREFGHALFLILTGLLKKMAISDYLAANLIDRVFDNPLAYSGFSNLMAIYGYALQIYCDFSGYTDMAIGLALLLGFRLCTNFNSPYKALSMTDFWRRWHISLSSWLRDYLYIPLGGNRHGLLRTYINTMTTMLLGGLWHGANLRFIIWGGVHGVALVADKAIARLRGPKPRPPWQRTAGIALTFNVVCLAWIFFRAADLDTAGLMLGQIGSHFGSSNLPDIAASHANALAIMACGYIAHWMPYRTQETIRGWFIERHTAIQLLITVLTAFITVQVSSSELHPFIYFRF